MVENLALVSVLELGEDEQPQESRIQCSCLWRSLLSVLDLISPSIGSILALHGL